MEFLVAGRDYMCFLHESAHPKTIGQLQIEHAFRYEVLGVTQGDAWWLVGREIRAEL
jgi:hypothetical protein